LIATLLRTLWPFGRQGGDQAVVCRILFVCMGNVCRSPTAEAVFRQQAQSAGLDRKVLCHSVGTHGFNVGMLADGRACAAAMRRGYDMARLRGRQLRDEDFSNFDLILAMDQQNLAILRERCPPQFAERLHLLLEFGSRRDVLEVPDPYYGNAKGFELVLDMIEDACAGLLAHVRNRYPDGLPDSRPESAESQAR
jgi:protein-tyrosine phosphatase